MPREGKSEAGRRQFLKATGAAALTASVAGCSSGDSGSGNQTTTAPSTTTSSGGGSWQPDFDGYPYGVNETRVDKAKQVMEEAGYGPDNRYSLDWLQYNSGTWKEMANSIRSRLQSAHIDMNISSADFGPLLNTTEKGQHEAYTLGWVADYPAPQNFLQLIDPENTIYGSGSTANGARLFWSEDAKGNPAVREFMTKQFNRIQSNPENSDEARQIRNDAAVKMEEGMWESAALIPIYHQFAESFWYDTVEYNPTGGMGGSRAKTSTSVTSVSGDKSTVNLISGTFNSLDPIASGNTESGDVIMDICDAPLNYRNGTTEVENLLVESYEVSDDLTTYTFKLKEGVQFHGDYGEVTADDVVYSLKRLMVSSNSTNTYFPISVMGIEHETDSDGNITAASGVSKTGEYSFEISLAKPFGYVLPVLAYGAFSVVPEGIVGDIEGYDGDMSYQKFSSNGLIGCGPFTLDHWESGTGGEVVVNAFSNYHGGAPPYDTVHRAILSEDSARYNYLLNNNADIAGMPTAYYDPSKVTVEENLSGGRKVGTYGPMEDDETLNYAGTPTIDTYYVGFNMEKVPKAVRQAMAYVVNQPQFVKSVFKGRGEAAFHLEPPQVYPGGTESYNQHYQG